VFAPWWTRQRLKGKLPRTVRHLLKTQLALLCDQGAAILARVEALTGAQTLLQRLVRRDARLTRADQGWPPMKPARPPRPAYMFSTNFSYGP
jgi:hypothetical protein